MTKITNHARGPRFFNIKGEGDQASQLVLAPGQTSEDVELMDPEEKVLIGMHQLGEISLDGKRAKELFGKDEISEARQEHEKALAELRQKETELAYRESELAAKMDKFQQMRREDAQRAGALLADPLPPGTDTEGGEESEEALERAGVNLEQAKTAKGQGQGAQEVRRPQEPQRRPPQAPHNPQQGQERPKG
jgi:hypothetical protein